MTDMISLYNIPMGTPMPAEMRRSQRASGPVAPAAPAPRAGSTPPVTRKSFTDRLGLPEDATNAQVLAAFDAAVKPKLAAVRALTDDQFYLAVLGDGSTPKRPEPRTAEDALYASMFGA
jgi:hypothetical protein